MADQPVMTVPAVTNILLYTLTDFDVQQQQMQERGPGSRFRGPKGPGPMGPGLMPGDVCPLVVTKVLLPDSDRPMVNGQVLPDASGSIWVEQIAEGVGPGTYAWPPVVP